MLLLAFAAALGNTTNYAIGRLIGRHAFSGRYRFIKVEYLRQTEGWFARHGAITVLLSRFAPIVRTFAPFVAGVGRMPFGRFQAWNVAGALAWVGLFVWGGYFVGNIPLDPRQFRRGDHHRRWWRPCCLLPRCSCAAGAWHNSAHAPEDARFCAPDRYHRRTTQGVDRTVRTHTLAALDRHRRAHQAAEGRSLVGHGGAGIAARGDDRHIRSAAPLAAHLPHATGAARHSTARWSRTSCSTWRGRAPSCACCVPACRIWSSGHRITAGSACSPSVPSRA